LEHLQLPGGAVARDRVFRYAEPVAGKEKKWSSFT